MFLVFALVLLVVAIGILVSVYSVFFPFMQNLGTVNNYHQAYYGAISAIERAELGLRYRSPGFVGSGGFFGTGSFGPLSDYTPILLPGIQQGFWWNIHSRTTSIPSLHMGNTDPMLSDPSGDSADYNQLGYDYLESFYLGYDTINDPEQYYTGVVDIASFDAGVITGVFRLPPKIHRLFGEDLGKLCDEYREGCDPDGDGVYNDIALSWSLEGWYQGNGFKIFPTIAVFYYSGMQVDDYLDNAIRESLINDTGFIAFDATPVHRYTPIIYGPKTDIHNVVSSVATDIERIPFSTILSDDGNFSGLRLSFGATNFFRTRSLAIYPYLEYQFTFAQPIADRFYTIEGHGRVGEYDVQIILKKPTIQGTIGGDFTVIF